MPLLPAASPSLIDVSITTLFLSRETNLVAIVCSSVVPFASFTTSRCVTVVPGLNADQCAYGGLLTISSGFGFGSAAPIDTGAASRTANSNTATRMSLLRSIRERCASYYTLSASVNNETLTASTHAAYVAHGVERT